VVFCGGGGLLLLMQYRVSRNGATINKTSLHFHKYFLTASMTHRQQAKL